MPGDRLAHHPEPGLDVAELAVAVGGLVEVHEVHVELGPGQGLIRLRVQVQQRLAEGLETGDPRLGRRERVHPGDHADHRVVPGGVQAGPTDAVRAREHRLPHEPGRAGQSAGQRAADLLRLVGDLLQHLRAVQVLAAGEEPNLWATLGGMHWPTSFHGRCTFTMDGRCRAGPHPVMGRDRQPWRAPMLAFTFPGLARLSALPLWASSSATWSSPALGRALPLVLASARTGSAPGPRLRSDGPRASRCVVFPPRSAPSSLRSSVQTTRPEAVGAGAVVPARPEGRAGPAWPCPSRLAGRCGPSAGPGRLAGRTSRALERRRQPGRSARRTAPPGLGPTARPSRDLPPRPH